MKPMVLGLCLTVLIDTLVQKNLPLDAIENIYAYKVMDKFQPVHLLKGYLNYCKKRIYKKGTKAGFQQVLCVSYVLISILVIRLNYE